MFLGRADPNSERIISSLQLFYQRAFHVGEDIGPDHIIAEPARANSEEMELADNSYTKDGTASLFVDPYGRSGCGTPAG